MGLLQDLVKATPATLMPALSRSATGNMTGIDVSLYEGWAIVVVEAANVSGTTPTFDLKLQESDVVGSGYTDIAGATATQVTTVATIQKIPFEVQQTKKFVRAVLTLAGTSPVYTCAAYLVGQKKY